MVLILPAFLFVCAVLLMLKVGELLLDVVSGLVDAPTPNWGNIAVGITVFAVGCAVQGVVAFFAGLMLWTLICA